MRGSKKSINHFYNDYYYDSLEVIIDAFDDAFFQEEPGFYNEFELYKNSHHLDIINRTLYAIKLSNWIKDRFYIEIEKIEKLTDPYSHLPFNAPVNNFKQYIFDNYRALNIDICKNLKTIKTFYDLDKRSANGTKILTNHSFLIIVPFILEKDEFLNLIKQELREFSIEKNYFTQLRDIVKYMINEIRFTTYNSHSINNYLITGLSETKIHLKVLEKSVLDLIESYEDEIGIESKNESKIKNIKLLTIKKITSSKFNKILKAYFEDNVNDEKNESRLFIKNLLTILDNKHLEKLDEINVNFLNLKELRLFINFMAILKKQGYVKITCRNMPLFIKTIYTHKNIKADNTLISYFNTPGIPFDTHKDFIKLIENIEKKS